MTTCLPAKPSIWLLILPRSNARETAPGNGWSSRSRFPCIGWPDRASEPQVNAIGFPSKARTDGDTDAPWHDPF